MALLRQPRAQSKSPQKEPEIAGYDPISLLKTPLEPPLPAETEDRSFTENRKVALLLLLGIVLLLVGVVFVLFVNPILGMIILFFAALSVVIDVFLPIK